MAGSVKHTKEEYLVPEDEPTPYERIVPLYQNMVAQSPLPLVITEGPLHTIGYVNLAFAGLLNCEPEEVRGRSLTSCLAAAGVQQVMPLFDQVFTTSVPTALNNQYHQHPQHGEVCWSYTILPILGDTTAGAQGLLLEVQDTTKQQRSERAVMESQAINEQLLIAGIREQTLAEQLQRQLAFISAITHSLGEGVYAFDQTGRVTYVNPTAGRLLGCEQAELLGKQASAVLYPPVTRIPPVTDPDPFLEMLQTGTSYRNHQVRARHKDGRTFPITYTIAPIDSAGAVMGGVVVFRDLSEIRQLEAMQEEYLTLLSHDLRTPLTSILLRAEQLLHRHGVQDQEKSQGQIKAIVESGHRMERMISDVIEQSVLEASPASLQRAPLDLVLLVRRMVKSLPRRLDRARIQLETIDQLRLLGDEGRIERVVVNLLTNALKYSGSGSPVLVRVFNIEQEACISVRDQGPGIDPEEIPHLFEKYYRAHTAAGISGTGLGLYSSQLIMAAHSGRIWVESEVGSGSTFTVAFPPDTSL